MKTAITHQFVEFVPDVLEEGVLYVSLEYATAAHRCFCGCGREVVTPISPTDWLLSFDGESVSLDPSIGNWSFPCRAHYWIRKNQVQWYGDMPQSLIDAGRRCDKKVKATYYANRSTLPPKKSDPETSSKSPDHPSGNRNSLVSTLRAWFKGGK